MSRVTNWWHLSEADCLALLDNQLTRLRRWRVSAHLRNCPACASLYANVRRTFASLDDALRSDQPSPLVLWDTRRRIRDSMRHSSAAVTLPLPKAALDQLIAAVAQTIGQAAADDLEFFAQSETDPDKIFAHVEEQLAAFLGRRSASEVGERLRHSIPGLAPGSPSRTE